jgi:DNA invertase Pin-like site-specific DNA recombinase
MKKAIELIRVSTSGQAADDRASIPAQRAVNRRTCAQYGLEIVRSIEISDVSGARVLLAPEIQELVRLIQMPEIHAVVAREFSRLIRPEDFGDYALLQAFVDSKTVLYLPEGPLDFSSKSGRLMGTIRAAIAGMERSEILERVWSAKEEKRKRGELAQSHIVLPWGVGYQEGRFFYRPESERIREAFRQFLAGNHSYNQLAKLVGVTPRGMHLIMRNPIWTGWRVIDKKRDSTGAGRYAGINGRQADRRKISRAPEDVIRVKVIAEPLISESDFQAVQQLMDLKQKRHWRSRTDYEHRFTYNGFLTCSSCNQVIHTALARRDYYACSGRRGAEHSCSTRYMGRERLEASLDSLFANQLCAPEFIGKCVEEFKRRHSGKGKPFRMQRLSALITALREKRTRVVDAYLEGVIDAADRDRRMAAIDQEISVNQDGLLRERPIVALNADALIEAFAPLVEWEYWTREQKRSVLSSMTPDIRVADYQIQALGISPTMFSNESSHVGKDSWRRQA